MNEKREKFSRFESENEKKIVKVFGEIKSFDSCGVKS
jgi:hypothetical protein